MNETREPGLRDLEAARRKRRPTAAVLALTHARIVRALATRKRYKYVKPRVVPEGTGWKIRSPNCSRSVDAAGAEIDIAWLVPAARGRWGMPATTRVPAGGLRRSV